MSISYCHIYPIPLKGAFTAVGFEFNYGFYCYKLIVFTTVSPL